MSAYQEDKEKIESEMARQELENKKREWMLIAVPQIAAGFAANSRKMETYEKQQGYGREWDFNKHIAWQSWSLASALYNQIHGIENV